MCNIPLQRSHEMEFWGVSDLFIFSIPGVCMWEIMMYGIKPFIGIKNNDVISKIEAGERLALPAHCPPAMYNLMCACWSFEPSQRPSIVEVRNCLRSARVLKASFKSCCRVLCCRMTILILTGSVDLYQGWLWLTFLCTSQS